MKYIVDPTTPEFLDQYFPTVTYTLNSGKDVNCGPILYKLQGSGSG